MRDMIFRAFILVTLIAATFRCSSDVDVSLPPVEETPYSGELIGPPDTMADSQAVKGGVYSVWGSAYPRSLNAFVDNNSTSSDIMGLQFESLVVMDSAKDKPIGILAESWTVSPDRRTFTFKLRPEAQWSDGRPITSKDFVFYYDTIMNPKNLTTVFRIDMSRFERPEAPDDRTLIMKAKEPHWRNFWAVAGMTALPAHDLEGKDFNRVDTFAVTSGPYQVAENKVNRFVLLKRQANWWGRKLRYNAGKYNFDYIRYRFMEDRDKALETFKGGLFDAYSIYTAKIWALQTDFDQVKKNWIIKQTVHNREPRGFQGFAINLRRERFQDLRVRQALGLLLNRQTMNEKLMYGQYILLNSYFPDLYPGYVNPARPVTAYNPEKAAALFAEAGYKVNAQGKLEKNGQILKVSFLTSMSDLRHLNLYVEDLKKVGIDASIEQLSQSSIRDRLNNYDYDLYWISWGSGRLKDPEGAYDSKQADKEAGANLPGVKDAKVDALIESLKQETNPDRRTALLKQLDDRLVELQPYILLWQSDATRILYWNKFGHPEKPFGLYNREDAIQVYWWYDADKSKALEEAMKNGTALPAEPAEIRE